MKEKFVWSEEYSVGVKELDEQHQQFIEIANDLLDIAERPHFNILTVRLAVTRLGNYGMYHLGTEEQYFVQCNYPEAAEHVVAHERYREAVRKFSERLSDDKADYVALINEAATFSVSWLLGHILNMDKKYVEAFHKCGLK
jgi:hemerythrin